MQCRGRLLGRMDRRTETGSAETASEETYNPWSVVNLVFRHLADEGLHPVLGECGDPGKPAAELLKTFGITPAAAGNRQVANRVSDELARLRQAFEGEHPVSG
jgi:hypothetical protein